MSKQQELINQVMNWIWNDPVIKQLMEKQLGHITLYGEEDVTIQDDIDHRMEDLLNEKKSI